MEVCGGKKKELGKEEKKKLRESWRYLKNNWKGIRRQMGCGERIIGNSMEGHVLSSRISSYPMVWSRESADRLSHLMIHWMNGGNMLELMRSGKKVGSEEKACLSATEVLSWERKHGRTNGKYIEALRVRISQQTSVKMHFHAAIASLLIQCQQNKGEVCPLQSPDNVTLSSECI